MSTLILNFTFHMGVGSFLVMIEAGLLWLNAAKETAPIVLSHFVKV